MRSTMNAVSPDLIPWRLALNECVIETFVSRKNQLLNEEIIGGIHELRNGWMMSNMYVECDKQFHAVGCPVYLWRSLVRHLHCAGCVYFIRANIHRINRSECEQRMEMESSPNKRIAVYIKRLKINNNDEMLFRLYLRLTFSRYAILILQFISTWVAVAEWRKKRSLIYWFAWHFGCVRLSNETKR